MTHQIFNHLPHLPIPVQYRSYELQNNLVCIEISLHCMSIRSWTHWKWIRLLRATNEKFTAVYSVILGISAAIDYIYERRANVRVIEFHFVLVNWPQCSKYPLFSLMFPVWRIITTFLKGNDNFKIIVIIKK